jgi:hypothetical protein
MSRKPILHPVCTNYVAIKKFNLIRIAGRRRLPCLPWRAATALHSALPERHGVPLFALNDQTRTVWVSIECTVLTQHQSRTHQ